MTSITSNLSYNVRYDIPRVNLGSNPRQNRAIAGLITLVPGADSPVEFFFGNKDGKFLNIQPFTVKIVFWLNQRFNTTASPEVLTQQEQKIILSKDMDIVNGYEGHAFLMLTHDDTEQLYQKSKTTGVRWGVFLINEEKQLFPMVVTSNGGFHAEVVFDFNGLPSYESIIGS